MYIRVSHYRRKSSCMEKYLSPRLDQRRRRPQGLWHALCRLPRYQRQLPSAPIEPPQHLTRLHLVPARVDECALPTPDLRSRVALWLFIGPALGRQVYSSRTEFIELSACMACGIAAHGLQREGG